MFRALILAVALSVVVGACTTMKRPPQPAVISDVSEDKVTVQAQPRTTRADIMAKARTGCGLYDRTPQHLSYRCIKVPGSLAEMAGMCSYTEHLYACIE